MQRVALRSETAPSIEEDDRHEDLAAPLAVRPGVIPPVAPQQAATPQPTASELAYGPTVDLNPSTVTFQATPIGSAARVTVGIRNADTRKHALDPAVALDADPFGDFAVEQTCTLVLAPGDARSLDVRFQPSRAGFARQRFQLRTDQGTGPVAELAVSGAGRDSAGTDARVADQDYQRDELDARTHDPLRKRRTAAERAVHAWSALALDYEAAYADWMRSNFEAFLGKTGGDVHVDAHVARKVVAKTLATASSKAMEVELEGPPIGELAINTAIESFNEWLFEKLLLPEANPEESALVATERVADESNAKGGEIVAARERAKLAIEDTESSALLRIAQSTDAVDLDHWRRWGDAERARIPHKRDAKDRHLADDLLAEWVLERAATPSRAASDTNTTAWNKARSELFYRGMLPTLERPDLFVHQCRREWSRIGMDQTEIEPAIAKIERELRTIEVEARAAGLGPTGIASQIAARFGAAVGFAKSVDPERTARAFGMLAGLYSSESAQRNDLSKPFRLDCQLQLLNDGAGVYVAAFIYDLSSNGITAHSELRTP